MPGWWLGLLFVLFLRKAYVLFTQACELLCLGTIYKGIFEPVISVFGKLSREKLPRVERKLDVNVRPCQDEAAYLPSHQLSETQGTMNASFIQA